MNFYDTVKDEIRSGFFLLPVNSTHDADYVIAYKVLPVTVRWVEGVAFLTSESRAKHPELADRVISIKHEFYATKQEAEAVGAGLVQRSLQRVKAILREIVE